MQNTRVCVCVRALVSVSFSIAADVHIDWSYTVYELISDFITLWFVCNL